MDWMRSQKVDVVFWSPEGRKAPGAPVEGELQGGTLEAVLAEVQPDIVHTHKIDFAHALPPLPVPLTVRGHICDFCVPYYESMERAARIWLFPHLAELLSVPNVEPLPAIYDTKLFFASEPQEPRYVVRLGVGNGYKDIEGFLVVARLCPEIPFVLALTGANPNNYIEHIAERAPPNMTLHRDLSNADAAELMKRAWVCLRSHDVNAHAYGMPVSIAEAMGSGLPIIARAADPDSPSRFGPEDFAGDAGFYYQMHEEAAQLVRQIIEWPRETWNAARLCSLMQAERHRPDKVLPRVLQAWRELI